MTFSKVPHDWFAGHHRGNGAQEQQQEQEEQQGTDSTHTAAPEAKFTRTASHARHVTHDTDTHHETRFPGWSITFSQPPKKMKYFYIYRSLRLGKDLRVPASALVLPLPTETETETQGQTQHT